MKDVTVLLKLLFSFFIGLMSVSSSRAEQTYTIAVVPQFTPIDVGMRWTPLLKRLEQETGLGFQLRVFEKIPDFELDFLRGGPDFVYLNPYHMLMAEKAQGYIPLVRGATSLSGILVVKDDGPIRTLADINGAKLAFPSPNAFGASLYMRALLAEKEKIQFTPVYVGTHQNVYRHVLLGVEAGGGGISATLARETDAVRERLRVLFRTPGTAPHPLAAHPRVPRAIRDKLTQALLDLERDPAGKQMLDNVELSGAIKADMERDYRPLEGLRLDHYLVVDKPRP